MAPEYSWDVGIVLGGGTPTNIGANGDWVANYSWGGGITCWVSYGKSKATTYIILINIYTSWVRFRNASVEMSKWLDVTSRSLNGC